MTFLEQSSNQNGPKDVSRPLIDPENVLKVLVRPRRSTRDLF